MLTLFFIINIYVRWSDNLIWAQTNRQTDRQTYRQIDRCSHRSARWLYSWCFLVLESFQPHRCSFQSLPHGHDWSAPLSFFFSEIEIQREKRRQRRQKRARERGWYRADKKILSDIVAYKSSRVIYDWTRNYICISSPDRQEIIYHSAQIVVIGQKR